MSLLRSLLATSTLLALAGCGESECRCVNDFPDSGSPPIGSDSGTCDKAPPPLELAACGERVERSGDRAGRPPVTSGAATVVAVVESVDGARVTLRQGATERTLDLPAVPDVSEGEEVAVEADGAGLAIRRDGVFLAYGGGLVASGAPAEALRAASDAGSAPMVLGDVEAEVVALCAQVQGHHSPSFCPDVGLLSFGLRLGETVVTPGERVELTYDGRSLVIVNRSITLRDDRYADTCAPCGDLWLPSLDVAIVAAEPASP